MANIRRVEITGCIGGNRGIPVIRDNNTMEAHHRIPRRQTVLIMVRRKGHRTTTNEAAGEELKANTGRFLALYLSHHY